MVSLILVASSQNYSLIEEGNSMWELSISNAERWKMAVLGPGIAGYDASFSLVFDIEMPGCRGFRKMLIDAGST